MHEVVGSNPSVHFLFFLDVGRGLKIHFLMVKMMHTLIFPSFFLAFLDITSDREGSWHRGSTHALHEKGKWLLHV